MATIGIACDNYKIEMFQKELNNANIRYEMTTMTKGTTLFKCIDTEQSIIKPITDKVTQYFIDKYKKGN